METQPGTVQTTGVSAPDTTISVGEWASDLAYSFHTSGEYRYVVRLGLWFKHQAVQS